MHLIMIGQAGQAAQNEFCPDSLEEHHAFFDRESVKKLIREWNRYATADERHEKIDELFDQTMRLVTQPSCASAIHALARALHKDKQLTGEQAINLIREGVNKPRRWRLLQ